ncbi:hypothetical protein BKA83DRAFT_4128466 [Pisolithus microcarpus]|nr:hypothetical protein BKA83DRAFT_4128466 [Pisolithus microcarpus]
MVSGWGRAQLAAREKAVVGGCMTLLMTGGEGIAGRGTSDIAGNWEEHDSKLGACAIGDREERGRIGGRAALLTAQGGGWREAGGLYTAGDREGGGDRGGVGDTVGDQRGRWSRGVGDTVGDQGGRQLGG